MMWLARAQGRDYGPATMTQDNSSQGQAGGQNGGGDLFTLTAAGVAGLIKVLLALRHHKLHPPAAQLAEMQRAIAIYLAWRTAAVDACAVAPVLSGSAAGVTGLALTPRPRVTRHGCALVRA